MMGTVDIAYRDLIDRPIGFAFGAHESTRGPSKSFTVLRSPPEWLK